VGKDVDGTCAQSIELPLISEADLHKYTLPVFVAVPLVAAINVLKSLLQATET
jgi:hypothetical protein